MPYKDPKRKRIYIRDYMRKRRGSFPYMPKSQKHLNHFGFLELEVQRLNHCLEVALNK